MPEAQSSRDYIDVQFKWLSRELGQIRSAIEKLSRSSVGAKEFEGLCARVEVQEAHCQDIRDRMAKAEGDIAIVRRVGIFALGILGALTAAWLKSLLGL